VIAVRRGLQRGERLGAESHPLVQLGERRVRVEPIGIQVQDLLVDGHRAGIEALAHVLLGDALVGIDRLVDLPPAPMRVAYLEPELGVLRIELEQLLILGERLVLGVLLSQLARELEDLPLVRRQRLPRRLTQKCEQPRSAPVLFYSSVAAGHQLRFPRGNGQSSSASSRAASPSV
jgi:hypothetical protein